MSLRLELNKKIKSTANEVASSPPASLKNNKSTSKAKKTNKAIQGAFFKAHPSKEAKANEKSLKEKNKELIKINKELDKLVYSLSHDLRAPLTAVLGLISIAEQEDEKDNTSLYLQKMKRSVMRLDNYIKDIIQYSRNTRLEIEAEKINLFDLINTAFSNLEHLPNYNKIKLKLSLEEMAELYTDKKRLGIILNNIISNSINYCNLNHPDSFINIQAKVSTNFVTIIIEDNGLGIEKPYFKKVFEMFYKASEISSGSGLGLYIVKETVVKLKGIVRMGSKINEGTTFVISIPNLLNHFKNAQL